MAALIIVAVFVVTAGPDRSRCSYGISNHLRAVMSCVAIECSVHSSSLLSLLCAPLTLCTHLSMYIHPTLILTLTLAPALLVYGTHGTNKVRVRVLNTTKATHINMELELAIVGVNRVRVKVKVRVTSVESIDVSTLLTPSMVRIVLCMHASFPRTSRSLAETDLDRLHSLRATSACTSVQVESSLVRPRPMKCPSVKHGGSSALNDCILSHGFMTILLQVLMIHMSSIGRNMAMASAGHAPLQPVSSRQSSE